jgi:ElaB/YqjD/DUF883 family membrane-anchored ribosome-binding protein
MADRNSLDYPMNPGQAGGSSRRHDFGGLGENAAESMADMGRTASETVDDARHTAGERLVSAASAVEDRIDRLPGGPRIKRVAEAAVQRLGSTAEYVRSHDAKHMLADVERMVKNNPGPALVIAAACGFVIGRALTRE